MATQWPPSMVEDGVAACLDLPLQVVDEAFERPASPAGAEVREMCRRCPIARMCLAHAMEMGEAGVWGGTTGNQRTRRGAPRWILK